MVFKCGLSKLIKSLSINPSAEFVEITIELKIHNIQPIANHVNGSNSLCFRKSFVIFEFLFSSFLRLSLTKDRSFGFCNDYLVIYRGLFSKKTNDF